MAAPPKVADADELIDAILAEKGPAKYSDGLSEDNWEEELEHIPLFMTKTPDPSVIDKSPGLAALQEIKYQSETPQGRATVLKEEGNEMFKIKKYREAVNLYSEALKESLTDTLLLTVLYCNRSAGHYHLGNYRSSIDDALCSKSLQSTHIKAYIRGAEATYKLCKFEETVQWCDEGLKIAPDNSKLMDIKKRAILEKKKQERDERKQKIIDKKKSDEERRLTDAIMLRGITMASSQDDARKGSTNQEVLNLVGPHPSGRVCLNEDGHLEWPVLFMYPEYGISDLIESFNETNSWKYLLELYCTLFIDHITVMFGQERPPWDSENKYRPETIEVWYEDYKARQYVQVPVDNTLANVLNHSSQYIVISGSPTFILLARGSNFRKQFITKSQ